MDELTAWSLDLTVEVGGHGVVSHTGSAALRMLADRSGLTEGLSGVFARRGFLPVHDRGRVLTDMAVMIACGGRDMSTWKRCVPSTRCSGRSRPTPRCCGHWARSARTGGRIARIPRPPGRTCGRCLMAGHRSPPSPVAVRRVRWCCASTHVGLSLTWHWHRFLIWEVLWPRDGRLQRVVTLKVEPGL